MVCLESQIVGGEGGGNIWNILPWAGILLPPQNGIFVEGIFGTFYPELAFFHLQKWHLCRGNICNILPWAGILPSTQNGIFVKTTFMSIVNIMLVMNEYIFPMFKTYFHIFFFFFLIINFRLFVCSFYRAHNGQQLMSVVLWDYKNVSSEVTSWTF